MKLCRYADVASSCLGSDHIMVKTKTEFQRKMAEEAAAAAEKVVEAVEEAVNGTAKVELSFKSK